MWKDFRAFMMRGNVVDLAIGVIIGAAFGRIVSSLVSDVIMPPIGLVMGHVDFSGIFIPLSSHHYDTIAAAKAEGAPTLNIGIFISAVIDFIIVAFVVFIVMRYVNKMLPKPHRWSPPPRIARAARLRFRSRQRAARTAPRNWPKRPASSLRAAQKKGRAGAGLSEGTESSTVFGPIR